MSLDIVGARLAPQETARYIPPAQAGEARKSAAPAARKPISASDLTDRFQALFDSRRK